MIPSSLSESRDDQLLRWRTARAARELQGNHRSIESGCFVSAYRRLPDYPAVGQREEQRRAISASGYQSAACSSLALRLHDGGEPTGCRRRRGRADLSKLVNEALGVLERPGIAPTFSAQQLTKIIVVACELAHRPRLDKEDDFDGTRPSYGWPVGGLVRYSWQPPSLNYYIELADLPTLSADERTLTTCSESHNEMLKYENSQFTRPNESLDASFVRCASMSR